MTTKLGGGGAIMGKTRFFSNIEWLYFFSYFVVGDFVKGLGKVLSRELTTVLLSVKPNDQCFVIARYSKKKSCAGVVKRHD